MPSSCRRILAVGLVVAAACTGSPQPRATSGPRTTSPVSEPPPGALARAACRLPREQLLRIWRGYDPERSGDIQMVPKEPNFIGAWLSHSGPWDYVQRVPLFLYGPGHVPEIGTLRRPVTLADLAPTLARYLDFDFNAPDGRPLDQAVLPQAQAPRLVLVMVWDAGGRDVLSQYPRAWPTLRRLRARGAWFGNVTVGSSPSVTQAIHATLGTGAFPRRHGLIDLRLRVGGRIVEPVKKGPGNLRTPTLADLYDRAMGNRPLVGLMAPHATLGMMGHGAFLEGGDRDIAADNTLGSWEAMRGELARYYTFPGYVRRVPGLGVDIRRLDLEDGELDGAWLGERVLEEPDDIAHTPASAEYQTRLVETVVRREGFGADAVPDLLFVNYRQIDKVSHRWSMNSRQMEEVVRSSDRALAELIRILDREVGRGQWVVAVTADHGATPNPAVSGAVVIDNNRLAQMIEAAFDGDADGHPVVQQLRVTQVWIDTEELEDNGFNLDEVAAYLSRARAEDVAQDPTKVPAAKRGERVFEAVFPSPVMEGCLRPTLP